MEEEEEDEEDDGEGISRMEEYSQMDTMFGDREPRPQGSSGSSRGHEGPTGRGHAHFQEGGGGDTVGLGRGGEKILGDDVVMKWVRGDRRHCFQIEKR